MRIAPLMIAALIASSAWGASDTRAPAAARLVVAWSDTTAGQDVIATMRVARPWRFVGARAWTGALFVPAGGSLASGVVVFDAATGSRLTEAPVPTIAGPSDITLGAPGR